MNVLSNEVILNRLTEIKGWNFLNKQIEKEFEFIDFKQALAFVNKTGEAAEAMDHHPDIFIHSWNKVKFTISTHSEGGVTEKDFKLAEAIEAIVEVQE